MKKFLAILLIFSITLPCLAAPAGDMEGYLSKAREEGILFGDEKGDLHAEDEATRAEFLAIATRFWGLSGGENIFSDVKAEDWFCKSIAAAHFCGIFSGTPGGEAKPYEPIKTEDAVAIVGRYYGATEHKGKYKWLSEYAEDYFGYAFENGMFADWKYLPNPKQSITRGEIICLLYRYREQDLQTDCFERGYPKLSANQSFNVISVDVMTKTDCSIAYALKEKNATGYLWKSVPESGAAGEVKTIRITADMGKTYDVYVKAVAKSGGQSRISTLSNVAPLSFLKGNGTEASPYVIYTEKQLKQIAAFPDRAYVLGDNIAVSENWEPIKDFKGVLDGGGYRIENIKIGNNGGGAGLFETVAGGTVRNLTADADISVKEIAGVIAGTNRGTIENCCVTGTVAVTGTGGGGICGINEGKITDCLSALYSVGAGSFAGGIAGQNFSEITNCLSAVETVTSDMYSGGIAGTNSGGYISGCVAANIAVYNTMTYNGGKISTNKNGGEMKNNYSFSDMVSNAAKTELSADSRNGMETEWEAFSDVDFYAGIGWNGRLWKKTKDGFRLICPKNAAEPVMEAGRTAYFPKTITDADGLRAISGNMSGHYMLTRDITLNVPWKTIDNGFSGTLDGNGHTVYNLNLKGASGMFSNITGGTVKNLNFKNVKATPSANGGVIAACNYGYIENCTVSGGIETGKAEKIGGITGENNGQIENCAVAAEIFASGANTAVGGICAENKGVISGSAFSGTIRTKAQNTEVGGICGTDTEGYIAESAVNARLTADSENSVIGGICAVSDGSQIYKCAGFGEISLSGGEGFAGGICGRATAATVYNCFSQAKTGADGGKATAGGICAEAADTNIQNTYASGEIILAGTGAVAGGICGKATGSFITQNVALNTKISAGTANAIAGESAACEISGNFSCQKMQRIGKSAQYGGRNGTVKTETELLNTAFYVKPLSENGLLGWDVDAWEDGGGIPVLTYVPLMENAEKPVYE